MAQQTESESGTPEGDALCKYLDWDSNFFGCKIARIIPSRLDSNTIESILRWCDWKQIDCVYFLADGEDDCTVRLAEENKFHFVDIRLTFERKLNSLPVRPSQNSLVEIRQHLEEDIPALREVARTAYKNTRFYYDARFPIHLSNALYETWIEKSCRGYADAVLVARVNSHVAGYASCHLVGPTEGQIGLVGVGPDHAGMGLGQMLVNETLHWFSERGVSQVHVVTQGRNCQAQRLYERSGFLARSLQLWYHRWFR